MRESGGWDKCRLGFRGNVVGGMEYSGCSFRECEDGDMSWKGDEVGVVVGFECGLEDLGEGGEG